MRAAATARGSGSSPAGQRAPRLRPQPRRPPSPTAATAAAAGVPDSGPDGGAATPRAASPSVDEAMGRVQAAMAAAQASAANVERLPSAYPPPPYAPALRAAKKAAQLAAVGAACAAAHAAGPAARAAASAAVAAGVALYGWRRASLSASGAAAALVLGALTLGASFRAGVTLLAYFYVSSKLTAYGDAAKAVDDAHRAGGQRDAWQVAANAALPAALALAAAALTGGADAPLVHARGGGAAAGGAGRAAAALHAGFLGYYACCCGDTWASELGQLSDEQPRLVTTLRPVRRGTNGAVTLAGLAASVAGGLFVGAVFWAAGAVAPGGGGAAAARAALLPAVGLGAAAGLAGSVLDSLLGATLQFTGYNRATGRVTSRQGPEVTPIGGLPLLSNSAVNVVSAAATAAAAAAAAARWAVAV